MDRHHGSSRGRLTQRNPTIDLTVHRRGVQNAGGEQDVSDGIVDEHPPPARIASPPAVVPFPHSVTVTSHRI